MFSKYLGAAFVVAMVSNANAQNSNRVESHPVLDCMQEKVLEALKPTDPRFDKPVSCKDGEVCVTKHVNSGDFSIAIIGAKGTPDEASVVVMTQGTFTPPSAGGVIQNLETGWLVTHYAETQPNGQSASLTTGIEFTPGSINYGKMYNFNRGNISIETANQIERAQFGAQRAAESCLRM